MMMHGWLNIYKPKGISSAGVVAIVKRALYPAKIGHAGTLDVEAEGVLPIAVGEATKLVRILIDAKKQYIFTVKFGAQTDTLDHAGKVIATTAYIPHQQECYNICPSFIGTITQVPPIFSALKIGGKRAYQLARENKPVELAPRQITIYDLKCLNYDKEKRTATYITQCSKGTYIRTLAQDIALSLQSLGFVIELRRTIVGRFTADNALNIAVIEQLDHEARKMLLATKIWKIEAILDDIPVLDVTRQQAEQIKYGQKCCHASLEAIADGGIVKDIDLLWIRYQNTLLAIGSLSGNCFNSSRVFNLNNK